MDKFKECPLCGKKDTLELTSCVELEECEKKAVEKWNRRPTPENKPLTLDELSKLTNDDWVWVEFPELNKSESLWYRAKRLYDVYSHENYGKTWLAYARKPKQEEK